MHLFSWAKRTKQISGRIALRLEALEARLLPSTLPHLLRDINAKTPDSFPTGLTVVGDVVYFWADDGVHGPALWRSDGTAASTYLVKGIKPGPAALRFPYPANVNGTLFLSADDGTHGLELWR